LGGNITLGDTVGGFMSFEVEGAGEYALQPDGSVTPVFDESEDGDDGGGGNSSISMTHLSLHKVPVVRVEGGAVAPPPDSEEEQGQAAQDTINVTLAVPAPDAEKLVFAMEF